MAAAANKAAATIVVRLSVGLAMMIRGDIGGPLEVAARSGRLVDSE